VPRSHAAERNAAIGCIGQVRYRYGECSLGVMPLFHTMGIRGLLMSAFLNGNFVCMAAFDAGAALRLVEAERISALFLVPTMFHDMVSLSDFGEHDVGSVRNLAYAGMSMTSALTSKCAEMFAPEIFCNIYGSSEIFTFSVCDHVIDKPGCAGRAVASMASQEAFAGYWKRPDADAKSIRDGWYFTGDLGRFDADGELYVVGRVDDMIISGGENIYPEEVEDVLDGCDLVRQAAVIGIADDRMGEKVVAFVEPASPQTSAERLDAICLESGLARFKRPRAYVFVEALPRSASGKLLRRHLRSGDYATLPDFDSTL
jgi:2-furoate---CoA ligase